MNNFIRKTSFTFLAASVAFILPGCEDDRRYMGKIHCTSDSYCKNDIAAADAASFVIGDIGYIRTGNTAMVTTKMNYFWACNKKTKIWSQLAGFPGTVPQDTDHFTFKRKAYIVDHEGKSDVWEYNPQKNEWHEMSFQLVKK